MNFSREDIMDDQPSFEEVSSDQSFVKKYTNFVNFRLALEKGTHLQRF